MIKNNTKLLGTIFILITTISYGILPAISQLAYREGVDVETVLFNKFFYACILMWGYIFTKKIPFRTDKKHLLFISCIAFSYIGIATTLYEAFKYISGSIATIISFTFPAMIIAIEMICGREKVTVKKLIALGASMAGMVIIVWDSNMDLNMKGVVFALGTAVCYVFYTMGLSEKRTKQMHSMAVAGYVLLYSTVFNFLRCLFSKAPLFTTGFNQFKYIFILAVVCAFVAILCYATGVKMIGPSTAGIINTFEPVFACIFGFLLVGDILTINTLSGTALIMFAVLIVNVPVKKKADSLETKVSEYVLISEK